jgi:hypothetical protein
MSERLFGVWLSVKRRLAHSNATDARVGAYLQIGVPLQPYLPFTPAVKVAVMMDLLK